MKKKIDNFELIKPMLTFLSNDDYYLLELIGRKKDSVDITHSQDHFGTYYVTSQEMLDKIEQEVKMLCRLKRCRAYINLNPKSKKKTAVKLMKNLLCKMDNDDFSGLFGSMTSAAGECKADGERKTFLIDVDDFKRDSFHMTNDDILDEVKEVISQCQSEYPVRVKAVIPTVNGVHMITTPFNCKDFTDNSSSIQHCHAEVKHNSPTLLYIDIED